MIKKGGFSPQIELKDFIRVLEDMYNEMERKDPQERIHKQNLMTRLGF
ncbi:MAG: hypothetical protein ABH808_03450 [Candidatus Kuenenbacteria bacterium]